MLSTVDLHNATSSLTYGDTVTERQNYRAQVRDLETQWQEWLHEEYASFLSSQSANEIYVQAWENGHASGYSEVESIYVDLASFVQRIFNNEGFN